MDTDTCQPRSGSGKVWTVSVAEVSNNAWLTSVVWVVSKTVKKCLLTKVLTVLTALMVLLVIITNRNKMQISRPQN